MTRILTILALTGLLITACSEGNSRPENRQAARSRTPVNAVVIKSRPLENKISTTGTLLANEEVELRPEISGRVTGVFFEEGKKVRKNELLLKINDSELKAQLKRKEFEEKLAADEERRKKSLFDISGISQEEYDKALNALRMVQAEKEVIASQLAETEIVAPFDGVIGLRYISEGSHVTPSSLVATMQDIDPMKAEFSVPEKYARQLKNGTKVSIQVGDSPIIYEGVVYAVESKIDLETRTIKARAKIPNPKNDLITGSFAKIDIALESIPDAIVIPTQAIMPDISGEKVFICENGKIRSVPVKTGIRTEKSVQVIDGLNLQDTLVTTGLLQLSDGKIVEIKNLESD